ncbi:MAG: DUF1186 domain-containing protein [Waterburya sp.]
MELTKIIAELENYTGKLPRQALEEAIENREAITPLLLETLEKWKDNLERLLDRPDYWLHIHALFLLAQFRETKAYPLIIKFFSTPGDTPLDVTGDVVTEYLGRILANVSDGNIEPLKQLIANLQANEFVRGAGLHALMALVAQGVISRELVIEYFEELFRTRLEKDPNSETEPDYFWTDLIINSAKLYPLEIKQYIDQAFESDLVEPFFVSYEDIEYYLELGLDGTLKELRDNSYYSPIENTIEELENWACFREPRIRQIEIKPLGIGNFELSPQTPRKKSNQSNKKAKKKMQKQARRKNRSNKK